jgi:hypothetical protein
MPEGKLPRTKAILEMHEALKEQGFRIRIYKNNLKVFS